MSFIKDKGFEDAFGKMIADGTENNLNLPSHFPYSPEMQRIFVDGSRVFPEYNTVSQYNHQGSFHELSPASGETVVFVSAERPSYLVQFEIKSTFALQTNQSLTTGDFVRCGLFNDTNGWFLEQNGSHSSTEVDLVVLENGSEVVRETNTISKAIEDAFTVFELRTSWYRVGAQKWKQFFTNNGEEKKEEIGRTSIDTIGGPEQGNLPLRYEVKADSSTSGLTLRAGSTSHVTLGSSSANFRTKVGDFEDNIGSTGTWVPIRAFRVDPNRENVNTQLSNLSILSFSDSNVTKVQTLGLAFDETNVTFGGGGSWSTPNFWTEENNVIQTRSDLSNIVDSTGTSVTSANNPGGFQLGFDILTSLATSQKLEKGSSTVENQNVKKTISSRDILVIMGQTDTTGDVGYSLVIEQDW